MLLLLRDFIQFMSVIQAGKGVFANPDLLMPDGNIETQITFKCRPAAPLRNPPPVYNICFGIPG